jgi:phage tail-like protein
MAIEQRLVRLTRTELYVEAGSTEETALEIGPTGAPSPEYVEAFTIQVTGLPDSWYSLSTEELRLPVGEAGQVLLVVHPPYASAVLGESAFTVQVVPGDGSAPLVLPGRLWALAPGGRGLRSRLLQYLPAIYRDDPDTFLGRFLLIFQSLLDPVEEQVGSTHHYLDPGLTPARFLPWLASWVGVTLEPGLSEATQREILHRAVELARWKGTRRGMSEELKLRTGGRALIVENFDGMRLGQDASLGLNTNLGVRRQGCVAVTLATSAGADLDQRRVDALVEELKPAHVGHVTRLVSAPSGRPREAIPESTPRR